MSTITQTYIHLDLFLDKIAKDFYERWKDNEFYVDECCDNLLEELTGTDLLFYEPPYLSELNGYLVKIVEQELRELLALDKKD